MSSSYKWTLQSLTRTYPGLGSVIIIVNYTTESGKMHMLCHRVTKSHLHSIITKLNNNYNSTLKNQLSLQLHCFQKSNTITIKKSITNMVLPKLITGLHKGSIAIIHRLSKTTLFYKRNITCIITACFAQFVR